MFIGGFPGVCFGPPGVGCPCPGVYESRFASLPAFDGAAKFAYCISLISFLSYIVGSSMFFSWTPEMTFGPGPSDLLLLSQNYDNDLSVGVAGGLKFWRESMR